MRTGSRGSSTADADVFFGDLPILLDAAKRSPSSGDLIVLDRHFTYEPLALAMQRGDEDFRLVVDRALSGAYRAEGFRDFFTEWFGPPDEHHRHLFPADGTAGMRGSSCRDR